MCATRDFIRGINPNILLALSLASWVREAKYQLKTEEVSPTLNLLQLPIFKLSRQHIEREATLGMSVFSECM